MKWGEVGNYGEIVRWGGKEGEAFLNEGEHFGILRMGSAIITRCWVRHGRQNVSWGI